MPEGDGIASPQTRRCVFRDDLICKTIASTLGFSKYYCRSCCGWTYFPELHNRVRHESRLTIHNGCPEVRA